MKKLFLLIMLLLPLKAFAAGGVITIDTTRAPYSSLSAIQGASINNDPVARAGSMFQAVSTYADIHGISMLSLRLQVFEFKWPDGSKERGILENPMSFDGMKPIPNTQSMPSGGGVGYTNHPDGSYYGGPNVTDFRAITQTTTVCVGGYCESVTNVIGYEWIYGPGGLPENEVV